MAREWVALDAGKERFLTGGFSIDFLF